MDDWLQLHMPVRARELPPAGVVECWLMEVGGLAFPGAQARDQAGDQDRRQALKLRRRFLLRLILGAYLGQPGKDLEFVYGPSGKPELASGTELGGLHFNLSHSGDWLALAVARDVAVGVDIEQRRELKRAGDLARRYFSPREAEHLAALAEPERSAQFFKLWTVREACIKAMGSSLARSLGELELAPDTAELQTVPVGWPGPDRWSVLRLASPTPLQICVVAPRPGMLVRPIRLNCSPR